LAKPNSRVLNQQKSKTFDFLFAKGILEHIPKEIPVFEPKAKLFKNGELKE
jgi:hypothetical protein